MKHKHLTTTEREIITKKLLLAVSIRAISLALELSPSSTSREILSHLLSEIYALETVSLAAEKRAWNSRNAKTIPAEIWAYIIEKLKQKTANEISGFLKNRRDIVLSHSTLV